MPAFLFALLVSPRHQSLRYRTALVLYAAILIIGSVPGARADIGHVASGLVLHSLAYGVLCLLIFSGSSGAPRWRAIKAVATIALMGALDECVQSLWPYRHATVSDWLVDCSAALVVAALLWALWSRLSAIGAR